MGKTQLREPCLPLLIEVSCPPPFHCDSYFNSGDAKGKGGGAALLPWHASLQPLVTLWEWGWGCTKLASKQSTLLHLTVELSQATSERAAEIHVHTQLQD